MYDKSSARKHLKDLVDAAAVGSGIHMESVEPGVIDTFLDLMQGRVVVALVGDERGECSPTGNRRRAPRPGQDLQQPPPREQEVHGDTFGFGGFELRLGQQGTDVGRSIPQIQGPDPGADRSQLVVDGVQGARHDATIRELQGQPLAGSHVAPQFG